MYHPSFLHAPKATQDAVCEHPLWPTTLKQNFLGTPVTPIRLLVPKGAVGFQLRNGRSFQVINLNVPDCPEVQEPGSSRKGETMRTYPADITGASVFQGVLRIKSAGLYSDLLLSRFKQDA